MSIPDHKDMLPPLEGKTFQLDVDPTVIYGLGIPTKDDLPVYFKEEIMPHQVAPECVTCGHANIDFIEGVDHKSLTTRLNIVASCASQCMVVERVALAADKFDPDPHSLKASSRLEAITVADKIRKRIKEGEQMLVEQEINLDTKFSDIKGLDGEMRFSDLTRPHPATKDVEEPDVEEPYVVQMEDLDEEAGLFA